MDVLARSLFCDDTIHCYDGSDESCCKSSGLVLCENSYECINHTNLCDGQPNCLNAWDEDGTVCARKERDIFESNHSSYIIGIVFSIVAVIAIGGIICYCRRRNPNVSDENINTEPSAEAAWLGGDRNAGEGGSRSHRINVQEPRPAPSAAVYNNGLLERQITGASSTSSSSGPPYPPPTLDPPPSPVTDASYSHYASPCSQCDSPPRAVHRSNRQRYNRAPPSLSRAPPTTPCSTDVCDTDAERGGLFYDSESYAYAPPPSIRSDGFSTDEPD